MIGRLRPWQLIVFSYTYFDLHCNFRLRHTAQIYTYLSGEVGRQYVQQYHTGTPETVQKQIAEELQTQGSNLRVVICSTSFSKGL